MKNRKRPIIRGVVLSNKESDLDYNEKMDNWFGNRDVWYRHNSLTIN